MSYKPEFGDTVLAYAKKYLAKNAWRTKPEFELDDLLQEAYILFVRLVARYQFDGPKHFMAMWKRALHNEVVNLARSRTRRLEVPLQQDLVDCGKLGLARSQQSCKSFDLERGTPCSVAEVDWNMTVAEAPPLVRQLIAHVEGESGKGRKHSKRRLSGGGRETTGAFLCRRAGIQYDSRFRPQFESWLSGDRPK